MLFQHHVCICTVVEDPKEDQNDVQSKEESHQLEGDICSIAQVFDWYSAN